MEGGSQCAITVKETWDHKGGFSVTGEWTVQVASDASLETFLSQVRQKATRSPEQMGTIKPFDPSKVYKVDRKTGKRVYQFPGEKANCTWNPDAATVAEAGLHDGAVLQIWNGIKEFL